jgi:F-type H+-transporting ATPase subunit c
MLYLFGLALATGFGIAVAAAAGGLSQARAIAAALEGTARQPEAGGRLFTLMILGLAFIESLVIYALIISFVLSAKLPAAKEILKVLGGG